MKHKGPLLTLVTGVLLALVLGGLSVRQTANASSSEAASRNAAAQSSVKDAPKPSVTAPIPAGKKAPAKAPAATPAAPAQVQPASAPKVFAGRVDGSRTTVAISLSGGKAIAYVCDGDALESWLRGPAKAGRLNLTGEGGAKLTATYTANSASGSVEARGKKWTFTVPIAHKPSALYRSTANVRGAKIVAGWIVLRDGSQVGLATVNGKGTAVPKLDPASGKATIAGSTVPVVPADPTATF
jgi:hypothetical protein